ncbi:DUF1642 domain-containing protein [Lactococcus lactis]|uniref:DUF1642 domain-containing protein n=1 Tax=Lactococcus lactis TaxID=1358 RepID=UPI00300E5197
MTKEMKRPTSHISGNSIKPALSKAVEFYTDNNRQAYECIHERDEYIDYLESKLSNARPQQPLPVVPECVAKWYEEKKNKLELAVYKINTLIDKKSFNDLTKIEKWFEGVENKPIETIFKMKDGYQVEKPQLFYLRDELTGQFLAKDNQFKNEDRYFFWTGADPLTHSIGTAWKLSFTQQEIDSMETGSYELVPVEDGE